MMFVIRLYESESKRADLMGKMKTVLLFVGGITFLSLLSVLFFNGGVVVVNRSSGAVKVNSKKLVKSLYESIYIGKPPYLKPLLIVALDTRFPRREELQIWQSLDEVTPSFLLFGCRWRKLGPAAVWLTVYADNDAMRRKLGDGANEQLDLNTTYCLSRLVNESVLDMASINRVVEEAHRVLISRKGQYMFELQ